MLSHADCSLVRWAARQTNCYKLMSQWKQGLSLTLHCVFYAETQLHKQWSRDWYLLELRKENYLRYARFLRRLPSFLALYLHSWCQITQSSIALAGKERMYCDIISHLQELCYEFSRGHKTDWKNSLHSSCTLSDLHGIMHGIPCLVMHVGIHALLGSWHWSPTSVEYFVFCTIVSHINLEVTKSLKVGMLAELAAPSADLCAEQGKSTRTP